MRAWWALLRLRANARSVDEGGWEWRAVVGLMGVVMGFLVEGRTFVAVVEMSVFAGLVSVSDAVGGVGAGMTVSRVPRFAISMVAVAGAGGGMCEVTVEISDSVSGSMGSTTGDSSDDSSASSTPSSFSS